MSAIVDFYRGEKPDYHGRMLRDIWTWDEDRLENSHNYIQVLFPNREQSRFAANAPLLDQATIDEFLRDERLRKNLATSFDVMLRFYGLEYDPASGVVRRRDNFADRARNWISLNDHNYLRITRILKCLIALGLPDHARAFFACLKQIDSERHDQIGRETFDFWKRAASTVNE
jgi:hypothetical protein